jgi:hypothetical protein
MTDFKHVDEQIKMLKWAWYGEPAHELMHKAADTMQALLDRNKELEAALTEGEKWKERCESLASFNPNWDMLEATQESLREHMLRIKELEAILDDARSALHESYRTFGYSHEQSALMVSQALSAGEGRNKLQDALAKLQEQK